MHTASKERMVPELMFSSERTPQLSKLFQKCSGHYALLSAMFVPLHSAIQMKNSRSASAPIQSPRNTICVSPTINYCLESAAAITLRFQLCSVCYKQRTVLESSLQSDHSPWKIWMISVYKRTVGKPCIMLPRIDTLSCQ